MWTTVQAGDCITLGSGVEKKKSHANRRVNTSFLPSPSASDSVADKEAKTKKG